MADAPLSEQDIRRLRVGLAEPPPERMTLRAGPWRLVFTEGELRYIRWGQREALRRIYVGVRDRLWNSVPARLTGLRVTKLGERGFDLTFQAHHLDAEVDFAWQGNVSGDADGTIIYRLRGHARRGFWRTRIGFCVLHPIAGCAGQPCRITHTNGNVEEGVFPRGVAPQEVAPHV